MQMLGIAISVVSILSVAHMQLELLAETETNSTSTQTPPADLPSNSTGSRFRPRQKKKRSSGSRIDANTPTIVAVHPPSADITLPLAVSFRGVAGLGHRLFPQSNAYHLAKGLYLNELQIDWGWCYYAGDDNESKGQTDIASHLFGSDKSGNTFVPIPRQQLSPKPQLPLVSFPFIKAIQWETGELKKNSPQKSTTVEFVNEVPHYHDRHYSLSKAMRQQPKFYGKDQSDLQMYQHLAARFQERHSGVQQWKDRLRFDDHTVIGLHIRQGNGEAGDFQSKGRGIQAVPENAWIDNLARLLLNFTETAEIDKVETSKRSILVFLATDSGNVTKLVAKLQQSLAMAADSSNPSISIPKVVTVQQPRIPDGKGVSYQYMFDSKEACLESWVSQMTDMVLLAESDVVIAGQYSSFTQTIPLSYQFEKAKKRKNLQQNKHHRPVTTLFHPVVCCATSELMLQSWSALMIIVNG